MNGSTASVSDSRTEQPSRPNDLVVSVNWIGDAIMAMPALQEYRRLHPGRRITMLARGALAELWSLHAAPDHVVRYDGRPGLMHPLFHQLRERSPDCAWILPNSFRSAWIAFRSGIPRRIGWAGGYRDILLTERRRRRDDPSRRHQAWEYLALMVPDAKLSEVPSPALDIPVTARQATWEKFGSWTRPVIGLIPGAARGPAKRWPAAGFIEIGRRFRRDGHDLALFGGPDDVGVCRDIAGAIGDGAFNFAGRTGMVEWAALMARCRVVVANDSGGMHLAAALGRPVIALYGLTDPSVTGPLGSGHTVLQNSDHRSRDIARDSMEAQKSLAAIRPEVVYEAAQVALRSAAFPPESDSEA